MAIGDIDADNDVKQINTMAVIVRQKNGQPTSRILGGSGLGSNPGAFLCQIVITLPQAVRIVVEKIWVSRGAAWLSVDCYGLAPHEARVRVVGKQRKRVIRHCIEHVVVSCEVGGLCPCLLLLKFENKPAQAAAPRNSGSETIVEPNPLDL